MSNYVDTDDVLLDYKHYQMIVINVTFCFLKLVI